MNHGCVTEEDRLTLDFVISLSVLHNYTVSHKTRTCDVCS